MVKFSALGICSKKVILSYAATEIFQVILKIKVPTISKL